jgi:Ferritin-like domain
MPSRLRRSAYIATNVPTLKIVCIVMKRKKSFYTISSATEGEPPAAPQPVSRRVHRLGRRSFLKGLGMAGATLLPAAALLTTTGRADEKRKEKLSRGDAAILQFLAAAEIIESDLWIQYAELGGTQKTEFEKATVGNPLYTDALTILDGDMPQYIDDNTDDELSHAAFLNEYLKSRGAAPVDLSPFATLSGSTATGSSGKLRITNLTQLNVDTSFWSRYRSDANNPDLDPHFVFPQAATIKNRTAIPRTDAGTAGSQIGTPTDHLKAIAFTAGFHFAFIEQGGTSLYPSLAQRVSDPEVLRIVLSIGPTETMHFQTWQDKAGNATPVTDTDPVTGAFVQFFDLTTSTNELLKSNLIMPEPCPFLSRKFPPCSIIRPTTSKGAAMGAAAALTADGLFIGQKPAFFEALRDLASDADAARSDRDEE